jgi:hypothetical protein
VNALQQTLEASPFHQCAWSPTPQQNTLLGGIGDASYFSISATPGIPKKPARSEGTLLPSLAEAETVLLAGYRVLQDDISRLRQSYVFTTSKPLDLFLARRSVIVAILREAVVPLRSAFGQDTLFRLELSVDEYEVATVYCVVVWRGSVKSAAQAFESFSEGWWLDHMTPATNDLVFIYRTFR